MLLIWYNPNHNNFYLEFGCRNLDLKVGDTNGFGHFLVSIYMQKGSTYISHNSVRNAYFQKEDVISSKKNRLITHLIEFLDKERRK